MMFANGFPSDFSIAIASFFGDNFASNAKFELITAIAASSYALGIVAASTAVNFKFLGFSAISFSVASNPAFSFNLITLLSSNIFNALAPFVASLGIITSSPSHWFQVNCSQ